MHLDHYFCLYVPTANGGVVIDRDLHEQVVREVTEQFAGLFGGATVTQGQGAWLNASGTLVLEPVTLVESFTDEDGYAYAGQVHDVAAAIAGRMGQVSVALEDCGRLFFV